MHKRQESLEKLSNTISLHLRFPRELLRDVDNYKKEHKFNSRSQCIYHLIRKGMKGE